MENSKLTPLQQDLLRAFFRRDSRFFLTRGAALSGFHLGHRETHDLDLFTLEDVLDEGSAEVEAIARELGATAERIQTSPDFHRPNKLCALLSRAELRDLVDVRALELAGYRVEAALPGAAQKDAGLTAGQLGWVLRQITLGEDLIPPGGVSRNELRQYLDNLTNRLARLASPQSE